MLLTLTPKHEWKPPPTLPDLIDRQGARWVSLAAIRLDAYATSQNSRNESGQLYQKLTQKLDQRR